MRMYETLLQYGDLGLLILLLAIAAIFIFKDAKMARAVLRHG